MNGPVARNSYEKSLLENIRTHGWHCTSVFADDETPGFGYSVGLWKTHRHPEIIVVGLPPESAHGLISVIANRVADPIDLSKPSDKVIQGYSCVFAEVGAAKKE